ncbi:MULTISPECIES: type II toxin-antitoxin system HicB family antitoxin [unclassified Lysobacter]
MTMRFVLALHTDDGVSYGVTVPDLPGCFSAGDTFDEAVANAYEAIDLHVEAMLEDGEQLPDARLLAEHQANPDLVGAVWVVIDAPVEKYLGPASKINITVPALVLHRIDQYAQTHGESRSGFLVRAAQREMALSGSEFPVKYTIQEGQPNKSRRKRQSIV